MFLVIVMKKENFDINKITLEELLKILRLEKSWDYINVVAELNNVRFGCD